MAANSPPSPRPTPITINGNPATTPSRCGTVLAKPKLAPDAISMALFGPGVIEDTSPNRASAIMRSGVIGTPLAEPPTGLEAFSTHEKPLAAGREGLVDISGDRKPRSSSP